MLEYEKKIMLTKEEYHILTDYCKGMPIESQINYYFDTDDLYMNRKGITCRIRAKNGKYKTTIKSHYTNKFDCSVEEDLYEGIEFNSKVFEVLGLHFQGELITTRSTMYEDAFCKVVLDWNTYLKYDDYEIEVEYTDKYEKRALEHLEDVAGCLIVAGLVDSVEDFMSRVGKDKSKSKRFFEKKYFEGR